MSAKGITTQNMSLVCVSATARDSVESEVAKFSIRFQGHGRNQDECTKQYVEDLKRAQAALKQFGLENELKVFGYTSYADRSRRGRTISGYEYSALGLLRVKMSEYDISAIWTALAKSTIKATTDVLFSLEDEDAKEAKLLGEAVKKARFSAEALALAAGKRLGDVRQIRYNRYDEDFSASARFCSERPSATQEDDDLPNLNPEPIEVECSVDVDWWLE